MLQRWHPPVFRTIVESPGISTITGIIGDVVLQSIRCIAGADPSLAQRVVDLPWFADGINQDEPVALSKLRIIVFLRNSRDVELQAVARHIVQLPWFTDGITEGEQRALRFIASQVTSGRPAMAEELAQSPWFVSGDAGERPEVITSLWQFETLERFTLMMAQPWLLDRLTDAEAALIVSLPKGEHVSEEALRQAMSQHYHNLSETISLPEAEVLTLSVTSETPFLPDTRALSKVRTGVEALESFLGAWNRPNVIVVLGNPDEAPPFVGGRNYGTRIVMWRHEGEREFDQALYHELAHFYINSTVVPLWLSEGAAEFLANYTLQVTGQQGFILPPPGVCPVATIHEFNEATANQEDGAVPRIGTALGNCPYVLGPYFLFEVYDSLGPDAVTASLRELYRMSRASPYPATEEEIYDVFLSNAPAGKQAEFQDIYRRRHGGPIPGS